MTVAEPRPALYGEKTESRAGAALENMRRPVPTWTAIATVLLVVMLPVTGWLVSISNRVAVLESEVSHMATSEQIAMQTQKLEDFEAEYRRDQINATVNAARNNK